jgi:hydroxymethylpyrimidine/phosphomethylpyrimidine kinase
VRERNVLVIAGTDSSGGAGLLRDVEVLRHLGVRSKAAVTAVTAQSNAQVTAIHHVPPAVVAAQIRAALEHDDIGVVKIGMLGTKPTVCAVAKALENFDGQIICDPVLASSSGVELLDHAGRHAMIEHLLPLVGLLTPNIPESAALVGDSIAVDEHQLVKQAAALRALGPSILLKGGHAAGMTCDDLLLERDGVVTWFKGTRLPGSMRGTGCALSSAIAASLVQGSTLREACRFAKDFIGREWQPRPIKSCAGV